MRKNKHWKAYILAYGIEPDTASVTNQNGQVCFDSLGTGMYLAVVNRVTQGNLHCRFDSALVALPGLGEDGRWQYEVSVNAKAEFLPPIDPDEKIELKVLKLWKGDEGRSDRPKSVEVEIFRDGISYEKVVLSEENHWSYTWSAKDDGANWSVVERNVPHGYTMTVDNRESSFVITNTLISSTPDDPGDDPKTGDTSNIMLYVLLMTLSGTMLIILGVTRKLIYEEGKRSYNTTSLYFYWRRTSCRSHDNPHIMEMGYQRFCATGNELCENLTEFNSGTTGCSFRRAKR